jgi:iron complex transport system substrate-binding protein
MPMKLNDVIRRFMVLPLAFAWVFLIFSPPGVRALEFVDEVGNRVAVPPHPQRIIALVPSLTEILFSLGLDERVVGVTDFATYPPAARKKPKIGSFFNLNLEKIISLHPDLIVASMDGKQEKIITSLREFHLPIYRVNPKSLNDIYRSINNLGEITATLPRAHRVILSMKKRVGMVEKRVARLPRKRVFYQVGVDPIVTVNGGTFAADLIRRAGGILVTEKNPVLYPRYSIERVIADNPQVIIISSMSPKTNYRRFAGTWTKWRSIEAVRLHRIYVIDADLVDRPSPRIVQGLEKIARLLHPEAWQ